MTGYSVFIKSLIGLGIGGVVCVPIGIGCVVLKNYSKIEERRWKFLYKFGDKVFAYLKEKNKGASGANGGGTTNKTIEQDKILMDCMKGI